MIGLVYIRKLWEMTAAEVADKLGVQRAAISGWEKNAKIPPKRLEELSELFDGIDPKYFSKQITEVDKLSIQHFRTIEDLNKKQKEYEDSTPDEFQTEIQYFDDTRNILTHNFEVNKLSLEIIHELNPTASRKDYNEKRKRLALYRTFFAAERLGFGRNFLTDFFKAFFCVYSHRDPSGELEVGFYRLMKDDIERDRKLADMMAELGLLSFEEDNEQEI